MSTSRIAQELRWSFLLLTIAILLAPGAFPRELHAQSGPTIAQFLSPASPLDLASARHADRLAWMAYEEGKRNVYTAAAPDFEPVRLTSFLEDDGTDLSDVSISDDGSMIVFVRGTAPNRVGWVANPSQYPGGTEQAIWAVRPSGGEAWRVAEGSSPVLSPDGTSVLYLRDGQIYRSRLTAGVRPDSTDLGLKPFLVQWGRQTEPVWSPDGSMFAWTSQRENHAIIMVYHLTTNAVHYVAPSVDCDGNPVWSADGRRIAFLRRPGTPFGRQAQQGSGGIGNPQGPAYRPASESGSFGRGGSSPFTGCQSGFGRGFGGRGRGGPGSGASDTTVNNTTTAPGFFDATFPGGYTLSLMVADLAGGEAEEVWHNQPDDRVFSSMRDIRWEGDNIVFPMAPPDDEFERYFSISLTHPATDPVMLTTTDGLIENATSVSFSPDGRTLYYCTNAQDIERRHIWAVPTSGGTPRRISTGDGVETYPQPVSSGSHVAVLYFNARQPASVGLVPAGGGHPRVIFPILPSSFPQAEHVVPEIVITTAPDSIEIHNQLFLPRGLRPGEKRPAIVFVHGGPMRQMLPAYHYMQFYHWAYAYNQWLTSQGYVVLSINYRGGVGYGRSFRSAEGTNARGNSEYQDVVAGARYLQSRADVDSTRIGIWGLSYGGLLTAEALARNSDIFRAGADLAGVHLYGSSLDTTAVSFESSAAAHVESWTSPVFLEHGDDDRNVDFSQTIGLVQLLRANGVYYELTVWPDETHEMMVHAKWLKTFVDMGDFFRRFVWNKEDPPKAR
jgi:dipeptidyl aminopeptidase/acylaminoacyl peptidase